MQLDELFQSFHNLNSMIQITIIITVIESSLFDKVAINLLGLSSIY